MKINQDAGCGVALFLRKQGLYGIKKGIYNK